MNIATRRLRRISAASGVGFMALALLAMPASTLAAHGGGTAVTKAGVCSANSTSKLKVKPDNGMFETEFEVDQNHNGNTWHVVLKRNGNAYFTGNRTTHAPSGSFSISKLTSNGAGTDTIKARAVNLATGEVCRVSISI
jgi:hypothetical protein